jgi:SAM-dependent methyltransferase
MTVRVLAHRARRKLRRAWTSVRGWGVPRADGGRGNKPRPAVSADYRVVDRAGIPASAFEGWRGADVAERQLEAYRPLLEQMRGGHARQDLAVAGECLRLIGLDEPTLLEIGCGNGYYADILAHLYRRPFRYVGLDYSEAMIGSARTLYPAVRFLVGDAHDLPFGARAFDIAWSGTILMHLPDYPRAVAETCRVARRFAVFHSVPLRRVGPTLFLTKRAYGAPVAEVLVNRHELDALIRREGFAIAGVLTSLPYTPGDLADDVETLTYVCERRR